MGISQGEQKRPLHSYTVRVRFESAETSQRWVAWMYDEHVEAVLEAGALSCELVQVEAEALVFEARYLFADKTAFQRYEAEQAPRLRQAGLAKFPVESGVRYERRQATVIFMQFREPDKGAPVEP